MRAITAKDRSALLRMAGNIAAGILSSSGYSPHPENDGQWIASCAVAIALDIYADPRLAVAAAEGEP